MERDNIGYCLNVESKKKKDANELILQNRKESQVQKTNSWLLMVKGLVGG